MFANILQVIGLVAISVGLGLIYLPIGIIGWGVAVLLVGLAQERGN